MVFFSCDGCGEMLKKNQVDAHASRCRRCDSVSCVDCSVSFFGDDYRAHTSCITEAERYEGKLVKKQTKRNPQQEWMDIVTFCQETAPGTLKSHLRTMAGLDNIPRKEKQFRNFTANSLNLRGKNGEAIVGEIWKVLNVERERRQVEKENQRRKENENQEPVEKEHEDKSAKQSTEEEREAESSRSTAELDPKAVQKAMKKALKQAPNRSMKLKELRRLLGEKLALSKDAKKLLKKIIQGPPPDTAKKSKVKVEGKLIMLV